MNAKNIYQLESTIEKSVVQMHFDVSTPIEILEQHCLNYIKYFGKIKDQILAQQEAKKSAEQDQEKPAEEQVQEPSPVVDPVPEYQPS